MTLAKQTIVTIFTAEGHDYDFLVSKSPFVVGRSSLSDLHLPAAVVSSRHFRVELDPTPGSVVLTDLASRNGTIADGEALKTDRPTQFDLPVEIEIADIRLRISLAEDVDESVSLTLDRSHSMSRLLLNSMMRAKVEQYQAKLFVERGPSEGEELVLSDSDETTRIGGEGADLTLEEPALASEPMVVSLVGVAYHLEPHRTAKIAVGKQRLEQPLRLRDGDRVKVGGSVLLFSDPIEDTVDEMDGFERPARTDSVRAVVEESPPPATRRPWTPMERILFGFSILVIALSAVTLLIFLGIIPV